jgi:putative hydrolase of the HAD superfamily
MTLSLSHRRVWIFDLDNTLYPPEARLFDQIETRMTAYVMAQLGVPTAEADRLRHHYWMNYGTTLAGLMAEHRVDPVPYLADVHEISLDNLLPDPGLCAAIQALPGRRIVYTNGSSPYAERVLEARGLRRAFDAVYGVEHAGYRPKPAREAFEAIFARDRLACETAVMFEDDPRNLREPHAMGLGTVHVAPERVEAPHIHFHTDDLARFLRRIVE